MNNMNPIPYISEGSLRKAEEIESKFCKLSAASGILFVGVSPLAVEDGVAKAFAVTIGVKRSVSKETVMALAKSLLVTEVEQGLNLTILPVRGLIGPAVLNNN